MSQSRPDRKKIRTERAEKRNEAWASLSPLEQLKNLDERLGKDVGAKKQRIKILAKLS